MVNDAYCSNCERQLPPHGSRCQHCGAPIDDGEDDETEPEPVWKLYAAITVAILSAALVVFMIFVF